MFSEQERSAFELGRRMAQAAFTVEDNPYDRLNPRLARRWMSGFLGSRALGRIAAAWPRTTRALTVEVAAPV